MESLKFLDLFAGVGGFRLGMEEAGHKCVGHVEWDKFARKSYEAIFETEGDYTENDIRAVRADELPRANVWCFGFPCQDISTNGSQEGFDGERSSLFYAVTKLIRDLKKENKPEYLFIENVKNLLSVNGEFDFLRLQIELDEIGYNIEWDVLNSKHFGVPQNRERIFVVGHLRTASTRKVFPLTRKGESVDREQPKHTRERTFGIDGLMGALSATDYKIPKQILIGNTNPSGRGMNGNVFDSEGVAPTITTNKGEGAKIAIPVLTAQDRHGVVVGNIQSKGFKNNGNIYSAEGIAPTVTTRNNGDQGIKIKEATKLGHAEALPGDSVNISHPKSKTRRGRVGKQIANTLLTGEEQAVITDNFRIRKLTPRECWRLQGFPDWAFDKAAAVNSNSQLYKQAGNSVTVPVIYEIAKRLEVYA